MSIRPTQRQPQPDRSKSDRKSSIRSTHEAEAHEVHIDPTRGHKFANEIAQKRSTAETSNTLELDESNVERVSGLLVRLRNLANARTGEDELSTRDLLASEDEYRSLQMDLETITKGLTSRAKQGNNAQARLAEKLQSGLMGLRNELGRQLANVAHEQIPTKPNHQLPAAQGPLLGQLDATIGKVCEYQALLQQLRAAVDTQLMKPIGPNKESDINKNGQIFSRLSDSKRQILESGTDSLRSTKPLDPGVALALLDSSKD